MEVVAFFQDNINTAKVTFAIKFAGKLKKTFFTFFQSSSSFISPQGILFSSKTHRKMDKEQHYQHCQQQSVDTDACLILTGTKITGTHSSTLGPI